MTLQPSKQQEPLATIAKLRAFAVLLCMDVDLADDLVHITLLRTGVAMSSFEQGGDASAWLFGKLRSYFYSEYASRSAPNLGANADGWPTNQVHVAGPAHGALLAALAKLSPEQREALVLVEAAGFCHSEAARICRCRPDTFKDLVDRARTKVSQTLSINRSTRLTIDRGAWSFSPVAPGASVAAVADYAWALSHRGQG